VDETGGVFQGSPQVLGKEPLAGCAQIKPKDPIFDALNIADKSKVPVIFKI
jgi:hypothetical protein